MIINLLIASDADVYTLITLELYNMILRVGCYWSIV